MCSPLFSRSSGVLVRAGNGRVDRHRPLDLADGLGIALRFGEDLFPDPVEGPYPESFVAGLPRPVPGRDVTPWGTGPDLPEDPVDHLPVITPRRPSRDLRWQQRLDPRPRLVRYLTTTRHPNTVRPSRPRPLQDTP